MKVSLNLSVGKQEIAEATTFKRTTDGIKHFRKQLGQQDWTNFFLNDWDLDELCERFQQNSIECPENSFPLITIDVRKDLRSPLSQTALHAFQKQSSTQKFIGSIGLPANKLKSIQLGKAVRHRIPK